MKASSLKTSSKQLPTHPLDILTFLSPKHRSSLNGRGITDFDEFIDKKSQITLRSSLVVLYFDPTRLIEIAV